MHCTRQSEQNPFARFCQTHLGKTKLLSNHSRHRGSIILGLSSSPENTATSMIGGGSIVNKVVPVSRFRKPLGFDHWFYSQHVDVQAPLCVADAVKRVTMSNSSTESFRFNHSSSVADSPRARLLKYYHPIPDSRPIANLRSHKNTLASKQAYGGAPSESPCVKCAEHTVQYLSQQPVLSVSHVCLQRSRRESLAKQCCRPSGKIHDTVPIRFFAGERRATRCISLKRRAIVR